MTTPATSARGSIPPALREGTPVRRAGVLGLLAAVTSLGAVSCAAAPPAPGPGELTGVVVAQNDSGALPFGGDLEKFPNQVVVAMTRDDYAAWYTASASQPTQPVPEPGLMGGRAWKLPTELTTGTTERPPGRAMVATAADGRFRLPWDRRLRVLCLAYRDRRAENSWPLFVNGCKLVPARDRMAVRLSLGMGVGAEILTAS